MSDAVAVGARFAGTLTWNSFAPDHDADSSYQRSEPPAPALALFLGARGGRLEPLGLVGGGPSAFSRSSSAAFSASSASSSSRLALASIASSRCAAAFSEACLRRFSAAAARALLGLLLLRGLLLLHALALGGLPPALARGLLAPLALLLGDLGLRLGAAPHGLRASRSTSAGERRPSTPWARSSGTLATFSEAPTAARGMSKRPMSALLALDRVGARLGQVGLTLERGGVLQGLGLVDGRPVLVGARGALLQLALGLRGLGAALGLGRRLRLGDCTVALGVLLALLRGELVLELLALLLVAGAVLGELRLLLGLARLRRSARRRPAWRRRRPAAAGPRGRAPRCRSVILRPPWPCRRRPASPPAVRSGVSLTCSLLGRKGVPPSATRPALSGSRARTRRACAGSRASRPSGA